MPFYREHAPMINTLACNLNGKENHIVYYKMHQIEVNTLKIIKPRKGEALNKNNHAIISKNTVHLQKIFLKIS